jgi:hypothetical protein
LSSEAAFVPTFESTPPPPKKKNLGKLLLKSSQVVFYFWRKLKRIGKYFKANFYDVILFVLIYFKLLIEAHRGGEGEEKFTYCTPSKNFKKLDHKNAIKQEN